MTTAPPAGKLAGLDKKLSSNLEDTVKESSSPVELSKSPVGPLADPTRWVPLAAGRICIKSIACCL